MTACKICGNALPANPITLENMPAIAQNLPGADGLADDVGMALPLYACPYCRVAFLDVAPVPYYREVIRAVSVSDALRAAKSEQFRDFCARYGMADKRVVEVGCGDGAFLSILRPFAPLACGLEYAAASVAACREQGLDVSQGFVADETSAIPGGPFDGFLLLMYLEHIPDPRAFLRGVYANLNDGAVGLIEVPNADKIFAGGLYAEIMRDHLFYYNADSLRALLETGGFDVVEVNNIRDGYVLSVTVRKRAAADFGAFGRYIGNIRAAFQAVLSQYDEVSVWGASHQTFFALSQAGDVRKIRRILDSAPFKQGRYSPVTHIPIQPPRPGIPSPAVIVSGGSYSGEIVGLLKGPYQYNGDIYVFDTDRFIKQGE